jgi:uncharacterized alpha-E superfamily protein
MPYAAPFPAQHLDTQSWQHIQAGILQRMHLLEGIMADVYGAQSSQHSGLLPASLVQGHAGYLRPLHDAKPLGGRHLHIAAFDLMRDPQSGPWQVVAQRTAVPTGLGGLLKNNEAAVNSLDLNRTYRAWIDALKRNCPAGLDTHVALLTPGPYNPAYSEHVYLAQHLGLVLVEGRDLTIRDQRLFHKTMQGLMPVHCAISYLDDEFLDPLELRADSVLGVSGLLQTLRSGNVLWVNTPGSTFLESPALLSYLPALCQHLLGEDLLLSSVNHGHANALGAEYLQVIAMSGEDQAWQIFPDSRAPLPASSAEPISTLPLSRRSAENLFWLGRYTERAINTTSLAQLALNTLHSPAAHCTALLHFLGHMAVAHTLVFPNEPLPAQNPAGFEKSLIAHLGGTQHATSVGYKLRAVGLASAAVRERFSQSHWHLLQETEVQFNQDCSGFAITSNDAVPQAQRALSQVSARLAAIATAQTEQMLQDTAWQLLHLGRYVERLQFLAFALQQSLETGAAHDLAGLAALSHLMGYGWVDPVQWAGTYTTASLVDAWVLPQDSTYTLAGVCQFLRTSLHLFYGALPAPQQALWQSQLHTLPDPQNWQRTTLLQPGYEGNLAPIHQVLNECMKAAKQLSADLTGMQP